jgi:hypothetical protein
MPGNLSLVIGSFWLGRWGPPGEDDGADGDPEEFQAEEDALVEAVGSMMVLEGGAEQQVGDGGGDRDGEQDGAAERQAGSDMRLAEIRMAPIAMAVNAVKARTRWTTPLPCWGLPSRSSATCWR